MQGDRLILKLNTSLLKKKDFFSRQFGSIMKIFICCRTEIRKCVPVKFATHHDIVGVQPEGAAEAGGSARPGPGSSLV